ncbi:hypothetical protein APY94_06400 [Thermococcus celericrescens]|uniref:Uncharacterized protein n=1 Tax=Thermococcus celericrescens TaxID=227598 RepID=A0A124EBB7_9EURY|nr:hypothetical protein [Thermococcus celericrescens]KUH33280.1 hypothetical protein APY94_06400 [Thermococcus celericrescens]
MRLRKLLGVLLLGGLLFGLVSAWKPRVPTAASCNEVWEHDVDEKSWGTSKFVWAGVHAKVLICNGRFVRIIPDPNHNPPSPNLVAEAQGVQVINNETFVDVKKWEKAYAHIDYIDPETGDRTYVHAEIPTSGPADERRVRP